MRASSPPVDSASRFGRERGGKSEGRKDAPAFGERGRTLGRAINGRHRSECGLGERWKATTCAAGNLAQRYEPLDESRDREPALEDLRSLLAGQGVFLPGWRSSR